MFSPILITVSGLSLNYNNEIDLLNIIKLI